MTALSKKSVNAATEFLSTETLALEHWQEWQASGVSGEIIAANVETIYDIAIDPHSHEPRYPIHEFLNWQVTRFGHQARENQRAWTFRGLDPLNHWERMEWGCLKLDRARSSKGKELKYEQPLGKGSARAFFAAVPSKPRLWLEALTNPAIPIILTEGAKKGCCLLSFGFVAIALGGVTSAVRTKDTLGNPIEPHLIADLAMFAIPGRRFYIAFDHDRKPKTVAAVNREINKLGKLLSRVGCEVYVISLPGPEKGVDDFIVAQGVEAFQRCYDAAKPLWQWQVHQYSKLTYPVSQRVVQRYLGKVSPPDEAKLVCLKSPKGTGKTESFIDIVEQATQTGQRVLLIGHRVQLVQAIADRVGLPYVTELRTAEQGSLLGYGLCVDSLHETSQARFHAENWNDAIVIIDECEQVFWHLLSADTEVRNHRIEVLQQLKELLINTLTSQSGRIYLSDADLTNLSIDFIKELTGLPLQPWLLVNNWKPEEEAWQIHHYDQTKPTVWLGQLDAHIADGGRPFVVTHSQKAKSLWSTRTLEALLTQRHPDRRILRIDSETIADPSHPAFGCVSNLNEVLPNFDIVIASPSIETGVSIDIRGHFTSVWGCFQGICAENSSRQSLARVREPVPRHLWVSKYGLGRIGNGAVSHKMLLYSQNQLAWANLSLSNGTLNQTIANFDLDEINCSAAAMESWSKFAARINAGMAHYRDVILHNLKGEGHNLVEVVPSLDPTELAELADTIASLKNARDKQYRAWREAIAAADDITPNQYERLKQQKAKSPEDTAKERKHALSDRYLQPVTPELIEKDDSGWYPKIRLYYYLTLGRDFLQERDRRALEGELHENKAWFPTLNRSQVGSGIKIMDTLGITELLRPDRRFTRFSRTVADIADKALYYSRSIRDLLGLTITPKMTPIQIVQTLLDKLGKKLSYIGKFTPDRREEQFDLPDDFEFPEDIKSFSQRCYSYVDQDDGRQAVYEQWLERDLTHSQYGQDTPSLNNQNQQGCPTGGAQ
jgi:hypothetical protein